MKLGPRILLAGALAALTLAGCSTASTEGKRVEGSAAAGSGMTVAPEGSADNQKQAQDLAEKAEKIMLDPALAPREKYPQALVMFRDALQIDPNNTLAKDSITMIEDIYKSMGRPVPE
jgi:Tfp pilus assembly protein PilF